MASIIHLIKNNPALKKFVHWLIIPAGQARPRFWVTVFINPFFHNRGKRSIIRRNVRLDVFPFNQFILGKDSVIETFSTINNGVGDVTIGSNSLVGIGNVIIGPVLIGDNIIIAQNVVISGLNHVYTDINVPIFKQAVTTKQIVIGDDCWIAANAVITQGITIGKHSVVAAGSVVTKDIPPYSVVAGNPAKIIKQYSFETMQWERL